jgi:hypothetical protein
MSSRREFIGNLNALNENINKHILGANLAESMDKKDEIFKLTQYVACAG